MIHLRLRVNLRSCSNRFLSDFPMHSFQDMCGLPVMLNTRSSKIRGDEHSTGGDTWWNDAVIKAQTMGKKQWRFRKNKNKMNWHRNTVLKYLGLPDRVVVKKKQKIFLTVPCNRKGLLYSFNEGHFLAIQGQLIRLYYNGHGNGCWPSLHFSKKQNCNIPAAVLWLSKSQNGSKMAVALKEYPSGTQVIFFAEGKE